MASFNVNDIKTYIENNRQQAMIGAAAAAVILIALVFGITRMLGGGQEELAQTPDLGPTPGFPGAPMPGGPPGMPGAPPMPGAPGADAGFGAPGGGLPVDATQPQAEAGGEAEAKKPADTKPLYAARTDPFAPAGVPGVSRTRLAALQRRLVAAAKDMQLQQQKDQLPWLSIYRPTPPPAVAGDGGLGAPGAELAEPPVARRTSGLLYGDRVLGLLETNGASTIVKPGDVVDSGGRQVRVQRIDRGGLTLKPLNSREPAFTVPLKEAPTGAYGDLTQPGYPGGGPPLPGGPPIPGGPPVGPPPGGPPLP